MGADFRREAITMLESMGISVEFSHHEGGPGQQEIDLRYADALSTADNIMTFRTVIREVALSQGIWATFMPKPFTTHPGSGMHTHVSLFEGDRNAFFEAGAEYQLSKTGRQFIAGVLRHASEITVRHQPVGQQLQAADRRRRGAVVHLLGPQQPLRDGPGADVQAATRASPTRIELRTIDSACNPYLAYAVVLAAGMKGIEEDYELPARGRGRRLVAHRARAQEPRHRAAAEAACPTRSRSPRTPSCWPRRWASTSSTSSCATSAPSGRSTAARSPPSSATGCCRSSEPQLRAPSGKSTVTRRERWRLTRRGAATHYVGA